MTGGCFESARASFEEELRLTKGQAALDAYRERKQQSFNAYKKQRQLLIKKANEGTQAKNITTPLNSSVLNQFTILSSQPDKPKKHAEQP